MNETEKRASEPPELNALLGKHACSFHVDRFGWVIASKNGSTLRTQSVEAHLLHAILCELQAARSNEVAAWKAAWKRALENPFEVRRKDLTTMQDRIDALPTNAGPKPPAASCGSD